MNISVNKIIDKMQQEILMAKSEGNEQKIRERLMAIRTLCDLVLEESPAKAPIVEKKVIPAVLQTNTVVNTPKLQEEDANGDSLFDF
ncbi:YwdI family protein [Fredinandcohnia sp. 179-A 10B2 NHS]|uniref:YwdI family protein n=1 Tax=Fredinandcohnia sp. 179-A 10B2 NHS TaxID=3235176 RepID=UPI0039A3C672